MSRHILVDRPDCQVVLGYDHMLWSFFGQRFNPAIRRLEGIAVDGWPTRSGLGTRRFADDAQKAKHDLARLESWAVRQQSADVWAIPAAAQHLRTLLQKLRGEWQEGEDAAEISVPAALTGALS